MTVGGTANVRNLTLTLSGRHPDSGRVEFSAALEIDPGGITYRAPRTFRADEPVQLHFSVDFRPGKSLDATALVSGFRGVDFRLPSPTAIEAYIDHQHAAERNCHLICYEDGQTSPGPCLTCPDGEYQIRICC
jgi:hypothetical protein